MKKKIEKAQERFNQLKITNSIDENELFIQVFNGLDKTPITIAVSKKEISFRAWELDVKNKQKEK